MCPRRRALRTLRYELDLTSSTIEKLEGRIQELRESPTLRFTTFLDTAQINLLETKLDELRRARDQIQARIAFLEGPPDTGAPAPASAPAPDDTAGVQDRAKNLERIARELEDSPYDVGMFIPGTHGNGALMAQVVLTRAVGFADDFAGAWAYAGVSATAETVLDVHRNGSLIGTITFGIGSSAGTFATAGGGAETFAAGDCTFRRSRPEFPI